MTDPYSVLGITPGADDETIKKAYRQKCKQYHPDLHPNGQESPELRAAANYIRSGFYEEALNTLNGIAQNERTAQWHYYAALANQGLGNNIRARDEARTAVNMEPNNYAYQNLLDQLQNPGQSYAGSQQPYAQPSGNPGRFCLSFWLYMMFCQLLSCCCTGRPGGFFFC